MTHDIIWRQLFGIGPTFWETPFMDFHGTKPKLLEIHAVMARKFENIRFTEANIFSALRPESVNFLAAARNEVAAFWHRLAEK